MIKKKVQKRDIFVKKHDFCKKFDENGDYVRKYVPELSHLQGIEIHEPWLVLDGYSNGYPTQIVDHAKERIESLARLEEIKMRKPELPKK